MKFWKMNGAGNDFILINNMDGEIPEEALPGLARTVCERHLSVGADGMMAVVPPRCGGDYRMLFFNSDGSRGEMCGNGARCICRYGYENGLAGEVQRVETTAGLVIGYRLDAENYRIRLNDPGILRLDAPVSVDGRVYECSYVELGDPGIPHAVVPVKGLREADGEALLALGRALRYHPAFPKGANVNFYERIGENRVYIKTYERGVEDFTYACGTGTGSTALVLYLKGLTGKRVTAEMRGGVLRVDVDAENGTVHDLWLTGPTNIVAVGELTDKNIVI